jgi:hypothetical protein
MVVVIGLVAIAALFVLEMSGSARREADSDHVGVPAFAATVPGGGTACQPVSGVPNDVGAVRLLIGTYGRLLPPSRIVFASAQGQVLAAGSLGGVPQGSVVIPVRRRADLSRATQVCLHVGGSHPVALGGVQGPGGSELVNGKRQPGSISLIYLRPGSESWWQLLPTLGSRFGLGKASFFGGWTLPVMAVLLLAAWVASLRLLWRDPS